MINAKDLRIGNYVMTNNKYFLSNEVEKILRITNINELREYKDHKGNVTVYRLSDEFKDTFGLWLDYLEPIPITEDWLDRLGFGYNREHFNYSYIDETNGFILTLENFNDNNTGNWSVTFENLDDRSIGAILCNCYFVHEVQNLIYSITKTELVYNPKETI